MWAVVWAEMRRRSPDSRRRVVAVSTRASREWERGGERERRRDRSDLYRTCRAGGGTTPKRTSSPESGAPIGPDPSLGPLTWAGSRLTLFPARSSQTGNIPLRPHDMTRIAHTEIGTRIVPQNPRAAPGDRPRVPHADSGIRPAPINKPALCAPTRSALHNTPRPDRSFAGRRD